LDTLGTANGIEVSPDEKTLYVNSSGNVFAYDLSKDGYVSNKRVLIGFSDSGMDGMRCDIKGNLYVTRFGKGVVVKISPEGLIIKINCLESQTNIAFGGTDGSQHMLLSRTRATLKAFGQISLAGNGKCKKKF
jgi:sugar lactone lactonase YvrE